MQVKDLDVHLKKILNIDAFKDIDDGYNGLQIGLMEQEIKKIALAVDVSIETIALAQARGADMLLTHHGILWGHSYPITGNQYKRLRIRWK